MKLHQTLEDRNNPEHVEASGPFPCNNKTAWLGYGYYFWDTHLPLAHTWGQLVYKNGYMICSCNVRMDETCWDLHGLGEHREEFIKICEVMVKEKITTWDKLLVPQVITWVKNRGVFDYKAIRALGLNSFTKLLTDKSLTSRLRFKADKTAYLDLYPAVQLCLLEKRALSLQNYLVVYPNEYVETPFA